MGTNEDHAGGVDRRTLLGGLAGAGGALLLPRRGIAAETPKRGGTLNVCMIYTPPRSIPSPGATVRTSTRCSRSMTG
jgi:hypothetical protein